MEAMRYKVECGHLSICDGLGFRVDSAIELTPHAEPGRGTGGANEIDDHRETHQRLATPVGERLRTGGKYVLDAHLPPPTVWGARRFHRMSDQANNSQYYPAHHGGRSLPFSN